MTLFQAFGQFAGAGGGAAPVTGPGMVLVAPSSITYSGTSASTNANGFITITSVTSLSVNGVFTSSFDDYVLVFRGTQASSAQTVGMKLRSSGTDTTGSDYNTQYILTYSGTKLAARSTNQTDWNVAYTDSSFVNGAYTFISAPALPIESSFRMVMGGGNPTADALIYDYAGFHDVTTSYDGFTLTFATVTGTIGVYGVRT